MDPDRRKPVVGYFLGLFAVILYLLYRLFHPFLHTFLLSLILAGLFHPVFRRLERAMGGKRVLASLLTCLLVFLTVFLPLVYFVVALSNEANSLYLALTDTVREGRLQAFMAEHRGLWEDWLARLDRLNIGLSPEEIEHSVGELGRNVAYGVYERARVFVSNLLKFFLQFLFLLLILFYLFLDGQRLRSFLFSLSPLPDEQERFLVDQFNGMTRAVLAVNGIAGVLQGTLGGLGFWLFGLPSPFLWGFLMAILAFLPLVGISVVCVPATLVLVLANRYVAAVLFFLYFLLISLCAEYLLKPRLVGQQAKMHTLLVLIAIVGGLASFGILGILYGPLIMTAFLSVAELYKQVYERELLGSRRAVSGP